MKKGRTKFGMQQRLEHLAIFLITVMATMSMLSSLASSQTSFLSNISFQEVLGTDMAAFAIWFSIFFCIVFFASKQIFGAEKNISAIFSIAVALLTTVGLMNAYPNIMQSIGIFAVILLIVAVLLLIYSLVKKSGLEGKGFKPNIFLVLFAYLIFWFFYRWTNVFPYSIKGALDPYQNVLDMLAIIDAAILIIMGIMKLQEKMPIGYKNVIKKTAQQSDDIDKEVKEKTEDMTKIVDDIPPGPEKEEGKKIIVDAIKDINDKIKKKQRALHDAGGFFGANLERQFGDVEARKKRYDDLIAKAEAEVKSGDRSQKFLDDLKKRMEREIGSLEREKKGLLLTAGDQAKNVQRIVINLDLSEKNTVDNARKKIVALAGKSEYTRDKRKADLERSKKILEQKYDELFERLEKLQKDYNFYRKQEVYMKDEIYKWDMGRKDALPGEQIKAMKNEQLPKVRREAERMAEEDVELRKERNRIGEEIDKIEKELRYL